MITTVSLVAVGGAIGAALRYLTGIGIVRLFGQHDFPVAIMTVNVVGSFLMGVFVVAAANRGLTHFNPFVMTGLLGGFTTFSAFSLETVNLLERGAIGQAAAYIVLSVGLSIGALVLGLYLARGLFA
jgi:CrcB protein